MILRHAKRAHVGLGYTAAALVIAFAIVLGLVSLALPVLAGHPAQVKAWLEHRTQRPVSFDGLRTHWTRRGPLVEFQNLRIGEGDAAVRVGDAQLQASVYLGLLPGHAFTELRLRGLDLTLERAADGTWAVRGLPGQDRPDSASDPFAALERLGELHVIGGRLAVLAPAYGIDTAIPRADVRLRVDGPRVRAGVRAWPRAGRPPIDGALDFDRATGVGRAYVGTAHVDLRDWASVLHAGGVRVSGGRGGLRAWAELRANRVSRVTAQGELGAVTLRGARLDGRVPQVVFDRVEVLGNWRATGAAWVVAMPKLRVEQGASRQVLDGLALQGGGRFDLAAARVDIAPLLQAAALTDRLPPATRRWIRAARPAGLVDDVQVRSHAGRTDVDATLASVGFAPVGSAPGLLGVGGRLQGDAHGLQLEFDPRSAIRFSWPRQFGADHVVQLRGRAGLWREGPGWRAGTRGLRLSGQGYSADIRGGLLWQGDGTRPVVDAAASLGPSQVPIARRFWPRQTMPPQLVQWLDTALVAGRVEQGRIAIAGDLDDWPFRRGTGTLDALAQVRGGTVKFRPDWPAAEDVDADVHFRANSFDISGRGRIARVQLPVIAASMDSYDTGALTVTAASQTDAAHLLELVRSSGLRSMQPDTVDALDAAGPAHVDFALRMPRNAPVSITGAVDLRGAMLGDRRWKLRFDDVHGRAGYDQHGFSAIDLVVRHQNQAGRLSLRAGEGHVREARNAFEAGVDATFDIEELLAKAPEMAWLSPYVAGRSAWTVGVVVPQATPPAATRARLQLRTNLAGTSLDLPAPLRKPATQALATFVDTPLPLGSGEVVVGLGNLAGVRARTLNGRTGVRVVLGSGAVAEPAPPSGLVATGRAAELDALEWIAFAAGGASGPGNANEHGGAGGGALQLQRVDISTPRLAMFGGYFGETRLQVAPAPGGALAVRVEGPTLAGTVSVPSGAATVTGRFSRVRWKSSAASPATVATAASKPPLPPAPASAVGPPRAARAPAGAVATRGGGASDTVAAPAAPAATAGSDPAKLPPLALDVDDLRIGAAQLGNARLRTRAMAGGLQLEQFVARGRTHRLDATGDWSGRGATQRTRIEATVTSEDFGALLGGFGFGGRVAGGKGNVRFDANWAGAPSDFTVAALQGSLGLDARDGRLLEIEPGAGRVLGLLSLAELPRRLTLDFRDFFSKGFAFNKLGGNVHFAAGLARTDDFGIKGPAAEIRIRGAANLRQQTFDQTVEVRPRAGNLLTAVGAIAGGPMGAAIGAAANAVLAKPLGQIGAKTYRVTGPWAQPKVEVMTREQTRAVAAATPAG